MGELAAWPQSRTGYLDLRQGHRRFPTDTVSGAPNRPADSGAIMGMTPTDYDSYLTLEEAIAALEDLYATGKVLPSEQPRIEHRPGEPRQYVIVIGRRIQSVCACGILSDYDVRSFPTDQGRFRFSRPVAAMVALSTSTS